MKISQLSIPLLSLLLTFLTLCVSEKCHPSDKKALLKLKQDLNNPYDLISWDPKTDCCEWYVVNCDPITNRITNLNIAAADLNCPIPASIGDLPYLENVAFHRANVTGQIPSAITKLTRLTFLDLRQNHLSGPVPSFLSELKSLTYLGLSFNNFSGSIPASLSKLPNLGGLLLDRNKLTGPIPASFGEFQQPDFYLYMSHNQLSGEIPKAMGNANFTFIDASRNRLEGDISFLFGKNRSIGVADFSRNMLDFDISKVEFPESLTTLDLNHNRIRGTLPQGLTELGSISLNVSYNRLCGKIPTGGTGRLQELDITAYFHNRCLCGAPLPACKESLVI